MDRIPVADSLEKESTWDVKFLPKRDIMPLFLIYLFVLFNMNILLCVQDVDSNDGLYSNT